MAEGKYKVVDDKPVIVIPKHRGGIRLIHDCCRPAEAAVNDYAYKDPCVYQTVNDALTKISSNWYMANGKSGPPCCMPLSRYQAGTLPTDGLQWTFSGESEPTFFMDSKLCFGSRKAPAIFNRITKAVQRMLVR